MRKTILALSAVVLALLLAQGVQAAVVTNRAVVSPAPTIKVITASTTVITPAVTRTEATEVKEDDTKSGDKEGSGVSGSNPPDSPVVEIKGINPQPEPPKVLEKEVPTAVSSGDVSSPTDLSPQPDPPGLQIGKEIFAYVEKCVKQNLTSGQNKIDDEPTYNKIDDEVTWSKCKNARADLAKYIGVIQKCVIDYKKSGVEIDDEVTWSKCREAFANTAGSSFGLERVMLNPQPEPPAPTKIPEIGNKILNPAEIKMLNPQPEPPATIYQEFKINKNETKSEEAGEVKSTKVYLQDAPEVKVSELEIIPSGQSILARFEHNKNQINIPVRTEVKVENGKVILTDEKFTYTLKTQLPTFYDNLTKELEKIGVPAASLENFEIKVQNEKPVYTADVTENGKLFGIIPLKIKTSITISADEEKVEQVKRPWYAKLVGKLAKFTDMKLLPNLVVTDIRFEPDKFSADAPIKVTATVKNEGFAYTVGGPDIMNGTGPTGQFLINGQTSQYYFIFLALAPGETQEFTFNWKKAICGADVGVAIAKGIHIEETTKEDNIKTVKAICQ